ncbi:phosphate ABC transporter permease subunit PstC [Alkalitalea saponilacus]|uniref:Phosphate transport system permease protein n=1 Tax=Alkalitalea saponilacus TaxID=889453 RepID=A0A1T5A0U0_9BACT|nr:phosphate ABC transporter permease subunit PstC [Alkalitalea saponilacus]ASB48926.1 phosphate ABC transporter permease subunit PstC [Alkalitalea saponilacus]SKB28568.1 phosphate transport system permease protein [Alkalitalea saponilacus]
MKDTTKEILERPLHGVYRWWGDKLFLTISVILGLSIIALAFAMAWVLFKESSLALNEFGVVGFLKGRVWDPGVNFVFGALPFLFGTMVTSVGALAIAFFPAIAIGIFVGEYAPKWLGAIIENLIHLIAAIPSVVVGIWGIFVFAPWMREKVYMPVFMWAADHAPSLLPIVGTPIGYGMTTATIILALMIIPYTTALTRDAIRQVPKEQREAAYALGATKWEVIRMAVLPYARGGILSGAILSFGRAIGETMAVAMLIGNKNTFPFSIFGPAATMPSVIINEFREAVGNLHLSSLMAIGLALFVISLIVNLIAAFIIRKYSITGGQAV